MDFKKNVKSIGITSCLIAGSVLGEPPCQELGNKAFKEGRFKEAIGIYQQLAESAEIEQKGLWLSKLALAYYRNQNDVAAFTTYLAALDAMIKGDEPKVSEAEKALYEEALSIYLTLNSITPKELGLKLKNTYAPITTQHPEYLMLNFLVAASYANLGMFDEFFERFLSSYHAYPNSYLAFKIKGILHIKLFERLNNQALREQQRDLALKCFTEASALNNQDVGLCKLIILFSPQSKRREAVSTSLKKIIENNLQVCRYDIQFYVNQAMAVEEYDLLQRFIDKAKTWYPYSRAVSAAEEILHKKIGQEG